MEKVSTLLQSLLGTNANMHLDPTACPWARKNTLIVSLIFVHLRLEEKCIQTIHGTANETSDHI